MRYLLTFLLCACTYFGLARAPLSRNVWLNEAATSVKVNALIFDNMQRMWLGAENGLYLYNGREVTLVSDNIRDNITALAVSGDQVLYGTNDGYVYEYNLGKKHFLLKAAAPVNSIDIFAYGIVISTLGDGAYSYTAGQVYHFTKKNGLPDDYIYHIVGTDKGWQIATDLGVFDLSLATTGLGFSFSKTDFQTDIARVIRTSKNGIGNWAGFQEKGVGVIHKVGRLTKILGIDSNWKWGQVNDILPFSENTAWIATEEGVLLKADVDSATRITPVLSTGKKINKMAADQTGNLWLATNDGLTQVTAGYLGLVTLPADYSSKKVTAITGDTSGNSWYTQDQDLYLYSHDDNQSRLVYHSPAIITCLYNDVQNRLWIGTGSGLLCRDAAGKINTFTNIPELKEDHILSIAGMDDKLWLSGLNGVEELTIAAADGSITDIKHHNKREGIGSDYVYRIFIDSRKRIWFATDGAGISMFDGQYHHWGANQGFDSKVVYSITEDDKGNIWTGTLEHGIYTYNNKSWQHYTRAQGLQDETITTLAAGASGHVLAVNARGIDVWYPEDKEFRHLNRRSRLGFDSSISDVLNMVAYGHGQSLYFPWQHGFLAFYGNDPAASIKPSISVTGVYLYLKQLDSFRYHFNYDENYLGFHFKGVNFANPEPLLYRYRLEGLGKEWIPTSDETITFPRLQPGRYRLIIQASLSRAFEHPAIVIYPFVIDSPIWQRWWFIVAALLIVGWLVYRILLQRVRSLEKVARLKQERITFEYEYLKSQVNPHFLFNSLNTLISLIEEDPESAVNYTGQLSDLYRETLSAHEDDLVLLSDEWAVLDKYLYIQQNRFGNALQLVSSVPDAVKQTKRIIPLALQLLVENAIKHNVVSAAHPLVVFIDIEGDVLIVKNYIRLKMTPEKSSGIGLQNIIKRYALVTSREVKIETRSNEFIVVLPLL